MSRRDNETFRTVEGRYQSFEEANPPQRSRRSALANVRIPVMSDAAEKTVGTALGFGLGALLLLLAVVCIAASRSWAGLERSGATVAYAIAAFFLLLAGVGGIVATFNHVFRVIPGEADHH
jgi:high-affinity nickel permease